MAKQSGIHQIRGKVGEHSYYKTTGVQSGLIRSINQGLSNRVKNDAAYANTRLNNREFGQAGRIAKALGQLVFPKYRPMVLPFSQSKMAAFLLRYIKQGAGLWGYRSINDPQGEILSAALNEVVKGNFDNLGLLVSVSSSQVAVEYGDQFAAYLREIDATGADIKVFFCTALVGTADTLRPDYADTLAVANIEEEEIDGTGDLTYPVNYPALVDILGRANRSNFVVIAVFPYREVNGQNYILQEHCTYRAFASVAGDTPEP